MNSLTVGLSGRRICLRPIERSDLPLLCEWRNDMATLHLWSLRRHPVTLDEFEAELRSDFANDRHIQMMIISRSSGAPVGTIFSYGAQFVDGHCWITTFIPTAMVGRGYGAEAVALMLAYLFDYFGFIKVYADVYEHNSASLSNMRKAGFREEGRFKEHRFIAGQRHDMIRFAIYSSELPHIKEFIVRLSRHA